MNKEKFLLFPNIKSHRVTPLMDPETLDGYRDLYGNNEVRVGTLTLENNKILVKPLKFNNKLQEHFVRLGNDSGKQYPILKKISWNSVERRLSSGNSPKQNVDVRLFYIIGYSNYLVKSKFTFGYQLVKPNRFHIYQTMSPLALDVLIFPESKRCNGWFMAASQNKFKRYILDSGVMYYVPANTVYVLVALKKTLFSVHITNHVPKECRKFDGSIPDSTIPRCPPKSVPSKSEKSVPSAESAESVPPKSINIIAESVNIPAEKSVPSTSVPSAEILPQLYDPVDGNIYGIYRQPMVYYGAQQHKKQEYCEPIPKDFVKSCYEDPIDLTCNTFEFSTIDQSAFMEWIDNFTLSV